MTGLSSRHVRAISLPRRLRSNGAAFIQKVNSGAFVDRYDACDSHMIVRRIPVEVLLYPCE